MHNVYLVKKVFLELLSQGYRRMALNLGSIQALDSAGIGVIIQIHTEINKRSGEFFVYGCPNGFERIFASTKLAMVIRFHSTFEEGAGLKP